MTSFREIVRSANQGDVRHLAELRWAFRSELVAPVEDEAAFLRRCSRWMRDALSPSGAWRAWVAERERRLVGNIWLNRVAKIPDPGTEPETHAYLSNLYVRPEDRGRGVGRRLLDTAMEHCRQLAPHTIFLWPSERSRTLYERAGFAPAAEVLAHRAGRTDGR